MAKKIMRLTESDLERLVNKVIKEQDNLTGTAAKTSAATSGTAAKTSAATSGTAAKTSAATSGQKMNLTGDDRISNLASTMSSVQKKELPQLVIVSNNPKLNNMLWNDFIRQFKITNQEIQQAKELLNKFGKNTIV
jgi:hypothetical protein